jgi:diaminopimelate epimerase
MDEMIEFSKMHGIGNDFIVIDDMKGELSFTPPQIRRLCDRHFGVGADGIIIARPSSKADAFMLFYNTDGTQAEMCGNGIRCLAKFLYEQGIVDKNPMKIDTLAGIKEVSLMFDNGEVIGARVDIGTVSFKAGDVPTTVVAADDEAIDVKIPVGKGMVKATCLSVGNPHCVVFVDDVREAPVEKVGQYISTHELFPKRSNVEFVEVVDSNHLKVRVYERGVGETLACGTGAVAAAAAACKQGYCGWPMRVDLPGGTLLVEINTMGKAFLTGPAELVYNGFLSLEFEEELDYFTDLVSNED